MTMPTTLNVLLVDDDPADCERLVEEVCRAGFEPVWIRVADQSGFRANVSAIVDVVLACSPLSGFCAWEALECLAQLELDIPVIVVANSVTDEDALKTIKKGAADLLNTNRLTRLGTAITRALEDRRRREIKRAADTALLENQRRLELVTTAADIGIWS
jgi:DNA-binding NtrC family response regulator